jgi:hypothetical protein
MKRRNYTLKEVARGDWYERNIIAIDTETTYEFPRKLRTIQLYLPKFNLYILGTDELDCIMNGGELEENGVDMEDVEIHDIDTVKAFLEIAPLFGMKLVFFNAPFDLGQIGFSRFRKDHSKVDMKLWDARIKKLSTGQNYIRALPSKHFTRFLRQIGNRWRKNPIVKRYFYSEWDEIEQRIDASEIFLSGEDLRKNLRKHLWKKDFVLDIGNISTIFYHRISLAKLCDKLKIRTSKKDYDNEVPLEDQLANVLGHAKLTFECSKRLLKMVFFDLGISFNPCAMVSPASLTKYVFAKMGVKRPVIRNSKIIGHKWNNETMLQNIFSSYYGGRVECKLKKQIVNKAFVRDFTSLYPHIAWLQKCWRYMTAEENIITRCTSRAIDIYKRANLDTLHDPTFWEHLNIVCYVHIGEKGALLPVRISRGRTESPIVTQAVIKDSMGWYMIQDLIAAKIRGEADINIMEAFMYEITEQQELKEITLGNEQMNTLVHLDPNNDDFFKKMLELRFNFEKGSPMYKMVKLVVNSAYGITCERNKEDRPSDESMKFSLSNVNFDDPQQIIESLSFLSSHRKTEKIDKAGVYFNPLIGSSITAGARLALAICEALCPSLFYMDTDSIFVQREEEALGAAEWWKDLIPLKHEYSGSFFCVSEKRYVLFDKKMESGRVIDKRIISAKEHGLKNYINIRSKERVYGMWRALLFNEEPKEVKDMLNEYSIRSCSLSTIHFPRSLVRKHGYKPLDLKVGDFFYMSVKEDNGQTIIGGSFESIQKKAKELGGSKKVGEILNDFLIHDSGKLINSEKGHAQPFKVRLHGVRLVDKKFSNILIDRQKQLLYVVNNSINAEHVFVPRYSYSTHKYGDKVKRGDIHGS